MKSKELEKLCGGWPGVTFDVKWGADFVASVANKMFAVTDTDGSGRISFKVPDDLFLALTEQPGIVPAPYAARYKWVLVEDARKHPRKWLEQNIRTSYELVRDKLPKKVREKLGAN